MANNGVANTEAFGQARNPSEAAAKPLTEALRPGKVLTALLGVACTFLLVVCAVYADFTSELGVYYTAMFVAVCLECLASSLPRYGYHNTSFFVCLLLILLHYSFYDHVDQMLLPVIAYVVPVCFLAVASAWLLRVLVIGDSHSWWRRAADLFVNVLRVAIVCSVILSMPGVDVIPKTINGDGSSKIFEISVFTWSGLYGFLSACLIYWLIDRFGHGGSVCLLEGKQAYSEWLAAHRKIGLYSAVGLVLSGYCSVIVVVEMWASAPAIPRVLTFVLGLLAAGTPAWLVNRMSVSLLKEKDVEDASILEARLRGARVQIDSLRDREQALHREVQKRSGNLELLFGMVRDLGAATTSDEVGDIVVRMIKGLGIPFDSFVIFVLEDGYPKPMRKITEYEEVLDMAHLLQLEEPIVRRALKTRRVQVSNDESNLKEQRVFKDERSAMCAPLIVSQEPIGCFYLGSLMNGTYNEDFKNDLVMLAACAAPSVHNVRLFESKEQDLAQERRVRVQVEAQNNQLEGLQNMVQAMGRELRQQHTLQVVLGSICDLIKSAQTVVVFLESPASHQDSENNPNRDESEREFIPVMYESPYQEHLAEISVRPGTGFMGQVFLHRSRIAVNDFREYSHDNIISSELSAIGVPLMAEDDLLGGIYVGSAENEAFSDSEINIIQTAASQAALAIKNAILMEQTRQQALTDGLTGLYTHRFFKEQLKIQIDDANRNKRPACLIMIDVDKFKQYNDTLGHPAGDALLQEIAGILCDSVRSNDVVCRQGGDEFSVIMKDCSKDNGLATAHSICQSFRTRFAERRVSPTASIGVSCYPTDADNVVDFVKLADEALYKAKRTGRDQVCVAVSKVSVTSGIGEDVDILDNSQPSITPSVAGQGAAKSCELQPGSGGAALAMPSAASGGLPPVRSEAAINVEEGSALVVSAAEEAVDVEMSALEYLNDQASEHLTPAHGPDADKAQ